MIKAQKYRIYPTKEQKVLLNKHIGACRFVYNLALETKMSAYSGSKTNLSRYDLQVQLKDLKNNLSWLKEINSQSLQTSLMNLDAAYLKFFKGLSDFPVFKNKHRSQSFQCPQNVKIKGNKIILPKFQEGISIVLSKEIKGEIRTVTISRTPTDKYYASILIENEVELPKLKPIKESTSVGLDLGIKSFLVSSDGQVFDNPKPLRKAMDRLKILQRRNSRKKKGSNNKCKHNRKIAIIHERVKNIRTDFLHKASDVITKQYDTIIVEDLNVAGMVKNHKLAQSINDVSWSTFTAQLKYKAQWRGKNYIEIGRFDPSSKVHFECGYINKELTLKDREWHCPKCNSIVDRDLNAAKNIKQFGIIKSGSERPKVPVELPTLVGALKQESRFI